jgi:ketosteroid isomerase-like protein
MAQPNVEFVQHMCEAFVAGDIAAALDCLHPDVEWHGTVGGLEEGRVYRGRDEVIAGFAESLADWERHSLEAEDFVDAGDRVVVLWHEVGRGKTSGAEVETRTAVVYRVSDGKVVEVRGYMKREDALAAVAVR